MKISLKIIILLIFIYPISLQKLQAEEKIKIGLLLCWLGIHRYRIINSTFGFGPGGAVKRIQCKICGIKTIKKG